ncbi:MAG TPA: hypothetical protein DIT93_11945 [Pelagibacterium sp.]|nr:hypothetical protein [Pelagibacterium sp.]|tara:strand:+ start:2684 stop:3010 length:327 start_codon:yes stop_codon:yes gene_type:complete
MNDIHIRSTIGGKVYDTATATRVVVVKDNCHHVREYDDERTGLYLTEKGQWFIAGEGGGFTRWGTDPGRGADRQRGEGIKLLTPAEAQHLLEEVDGGLVEAFFEVEDG